MKIFSLINPDNTLSVNRRLAHSIGLCETVMYSAILAKYAWYEKNGRLTEDGWLFNGGRHGGEHLSHGIPAEALYQGSGKCRADTVQQEGTSGEKALFRH